MPKNARILRYICAKNTFSPEFWGTIPGSKAESERIRTNTNYVIMAGIVHSFFGRNRAKSTVYAPPYVTLQH